ncbi:glycosyltransferase [Halorhodospira neutriphila]|uniref:glycosyltransferase n=1 Tax=Halorhodospira neutriphila TaxID=168379 RepID=UPI003084684D
MTEDGRIALLFATSGHSGVDRVVANLLPELARSGQAFDLLRIRGHGPYLEALPANVRDCPLPAAHRNTVLPGLVRYLRRERPQALLTASHRLNRAALQARYLTRLPSRVVIRMGMTLRGQAEALGPRRGRRLLRAMRRWYPRAEAVVCPSQGLGEELRELAGVPAERLHVIPNPIVTARLERLAAEPVDDEWLGGEGPPVVLAAGSLEPRKDLATLLRAFAHLRQRRPARLIILGEGGERGALERQAAALGIAADVRLPGFEPNPYRYMARADAFALTSWREGSGAVLVEALACGTPAVATDCPVGPGEILQDGAVGPLAPVGDDRAVAEGLERVLADPPSAATLRAAAEPFRAEASAAAYLAALGVAT